ncbi:MAG: enoyl-CoA hydratase/isomerase family protein [Bdellovibrionales bacterium]|nr:enoyl-CoA hydratase/isomerase family protein [Ramlibacter sp.]
MSLVNTHLHRGVLTLTLADAANRNALSLQLVSDLLGAIDAAEADPQVRVMVLTNEGSVFCAGADLRQQSAAGVSAASNPAAPLQRASMPELFSRFRNSPKPWVGRLAGHCVAGGMGLAAAMDISIAADDIKFGFTEVRIGVSPAMISVICLPKMRAADARAAFLRGNRFDAAEAARLGLINTAVPRGQLDAEVAQVVDDLLRGGPEAIAATKQVLNQVPQMNYDDASAWTAELSARLFKSDEGREGMAAYLEKRDAVWVP